MTAIEITLEPSEQPSQVNVSIGITDDDINEEVKGFVVELDLVSALRKADVAISNTSILVRILDDDRKYFSNLVCLRMSFDLVLGTFDVTLMYM